LSFEEGVWAEMTTPDVEPTVATMDETARDVYSIAPTEVELDLPPTSAKVGEARPAHPAQLDSTTMPRPTHEVPVYWIEPQPEWSSYREIEPILDLATSHGVTKFRDKEGALAVLMAYQSRVSSTECAETQEHVYLATPEDLDKPSDHPRGVEDMDLHNLVDLHRHFDQERRALPSELVVPGKMHGLAIGILIDSGATLSIVSTKFWSQLRALNPKLALIPTNVRLTTASGASMRARGHLLLEVELAGQFYLHQFTVVDSQEPAIIGLDFLAKHDVECDWRRGVLRLRGTEVRTVRQYSVGDGKTRKLSASRRIVVPASSQHLVEVSVKVKDQMDLPDWGIVQPIKKTVRDYGIMAGKAVLDPHSGTILIPVINPTDSAVVIPAQAPLALLAPAQLVQMFPCNQSPINQSTNQCYNACFEANTFQTAHCRSPPSVVHPTQGVNCQDVSSAVPLVGELSPVSDVSAPSDLVSGATGMSGQASCLPAIAHPTLGLRQADAELGLPMAQQGIDTYQKSWSDLSSDDDEPNPQNDLHSQRVLDFASHCKFPEHLRDLLVDGSRELETDAELHCFAEFLIRNNDVFAKSSADLGRTNIVQHTIDTGDSKPVRQPPRRIPIHKRPLVQAEIKNMLERGVIEPCDGPWSSPIVLVTKKDGDVRLCVDFRTVNNLTKKDAYPLPRIEDNLDALQGAVWYSTLDLLSGFWQVEVAPGDRDKTAFSAGGIGLFRFITMPFGLTGAPATFERLMERVLLGLQWQIAVLYIDDIVVFASDFFTHLDRLDQVLARLRTAGLNLKPGKCHLLKHRVEFLGHIVSSQGVEVDPGKVNKVLSWPVPKNLTQVRSFVGLCAYYRRFIPNFSTLAKPLFSLTEKSQEFKWGEPQAKSFSALKIALTQAPILAYPKTGAQYILDTDASNVGIGAVLSQVQDGEERVIAYASKTLHQAQRNYCVTRREALAIVTFVKHFHHYLCGTQFLVRTDHAALYWLLRKRDPEGQMARWSVFLQAYDMRIEHRPGHKHGNADAMSRCMEGCRDVDQLDFVPGTVKTLDELRDDAVQRLRTVQTRAQKRKEMEQDWAERTQLPDFEWMFGPGDQDLGSTLSRGEPGGPEHARIDDRKEPPSSNPCRGEIRPQDPSTPAMSDRDRSVEVPPSGKKVLEPPTLPPQLSTDLSLTLPLDPLLAENKDVSAEMRPDIQIKTPHKLTPQEEDKNFWEQQGEDDRVKQFLRDEDPEQWSSAAMAHLQDKDPDIAKLKTWMRTGTKPVWQEVVSENAAIKAWWSRWDQLHLSPANNILYIRWEDSHPHIPPKFRVVAVPIMYPAILRQLHDAKTAGHLGQSKTVDRIKKSPFYWPGMIDYTLRWVRGCNTCAARKSPLHSKRTPLQTYYCGATGDRYACDICGPFHPPTKRGNTRIFTILDWHTRFIKAYAIKRNTADTIAPCIMDFISTFGVPLELYSDGGKELVGEVVQGVCKLLGITKLNTTAYRPSSNGIVERDNGTIKAMLTAFVNRRGTDWDEHLDAVMMAYRSSVHRTLGETPNMMMLGREVRLPLDALIPPPPEVEHQTLPPSGYAAQLVEVMREVHQTVADHVGQRYRYQKRYYDRNVKPQAFCVGQAVWLRIYPKIVGQSKSLMKYWDETWVVIARISLVHYKIQKTPQGKSCIVHSDRLKIHYGLITDPATKRLWLSLQPKADRVDRLAVVPSQHSNSLSLK